MALGAARLLPESCAKERSQAGVSCGLGGAHVGGGEGRGRLEDGRVPAPGLIPGLANGKVASPIGLASRQSLAAGIQIA